MAENNRTPGQLVRHARLECGVSQAELAVRAGTTQSAISRIESDQVSPTVDYLSRLLTCLGCDLMLGVATMDTWADEHDLRTWQALGMSDRLVAASATLEQFGDLAGAARG